MHAEPRITANELARYMITPDTGRIGIIKRAKTSNTAVRTRYNDVRTVIRSALTDPVNERRILAAAYESFEQRQGDASLSPFVKDDAAKSLEVINAYKGMRNSLAVRDFVAPPPRQAPITIGGVKVSVTADVLLHGEDKGKATIGAALFRFTQPEDESDTRAIAKRREMGIYAATLVRMYVAENFSGERIVHYPHCWSVDIQCGDVHTAPKAFLQREQQIASACRFIAAIWNDV